MLEWLPVTVSAVQPLAKEIVGIELAPIQGTILPAWTPGSHINVQLDNGLVRSYSLCNRPDENAFYRIAVKREQNSRGGSAAMFELTAGQRLQISSPANAFELDDQAPCHVLIAGGIGITPIWAMYSALRAANIPAQLHYFAQSEQQAAFIPEVRAAGGQIYLGLDETFSFAKLTDIVTTLPQQSALYSCGPSGLLDSVSIIANSQDISPQRQHQERFSATAKSTPGQAFSQQTAKPFTVVFAQSGTECAVEPHQSIVSAAANAGVAIPTSCEMGICGSCQTAVLEGEPDHADQVLTDDERHSGRTIIPCISRCQSERLVLDL